MKLILKQRKKEAGNTESFVFQSEQGLSWQAGQFLHCWFEHQNTDDRGEERYFTISSAPFEEKIMLTTRFFGDQSSSFKKAFFSMKEGDVLSAEGPEGDFIIDKDDREFIFIAGGIGITPYRSMILDLDHKGKSIKGKLLYGNKDENFVFKEELEDVMAKHSDFSIHYFMGDKKINEEAIKKLVSEIGKPIFYVSGPEPMVEAFEKMLLKLGVAESDLKRDYFPGYSWP